MEEHWMGSKDSATRGGMTSFIIIQIIYHITYHFIIVIIIIIKVDHLHGRMFIDRVTLDIDVSFQIDHFSSFENEDKSRLILNN